MKPLSERMRTAKRLKSYDAGDVVADWMVDEWADEVAQREAENEWLEQAELIAREGLIWYQREFPDCIKATITLNEMNKALGGE